MSELVEQLVATAGALVDDGLVRGAGGNVSVREGDVMSISPSGFSFKDAAPSDYPGVSLESGEIVRGERRPSSEVLMHLAIYRNRPEVTAIVHTHPPVTVALVSSGHDLRAMYPDYYVFLGRNVPHLPYITATTPEMARAVEEVAKAPDCYGVILRNHGVVTMGTNLKEAYFRTLAVEEQATILHGALQVGEPVYLTVAECDALDELGSEKYRKALLAAMSADA